MQHEPENEMSLKEQLELVNYMIACCLEPVIEAAGFWFGAWCLAQVIYCFV